MSINSSISIIVPCYNQAHYLSETLQSVLDQEYSNWECLIVNDGSPDNTEEVALEWCERDDRFKYLKKQNGGLADARNYGIKRSQGTYVLVLDSDDKISKNYTSEAIKVLDEDSSIKLVSCKSMLFDGVNEEAQLLPYTYDNLLFVRNCFFCSSIYRRVDYDKIPEGYNTNMKGGWEDYDFWVSLLNRNDNVVVLDKIHFYYRIKDGSMRSLITTELENKLQLQIFKNHVDKYLSEINPIEQYRELIKYKGIENSLQYKLGSFILAPIRYLRTLFKK